MRKSDLITLDDKTIEYNYSGLFDTDKPWIHGAITLDTYEIILVAAGKVHIREGSREYELAPGELIVLAPGVEHAGTRESRGHTSFYWLHFFMPSSKPFFPKTATPHGGERALREIMHYARYDAGLAEVALMKFLLGLSAPEKRGNKLAHEVDEYIRANAPFRVTAKSTAAQFGFSADYLSRIYRREFGVDLKSGIIRHQLDYAESLLINTDYTIKEIAAACGFEDENNFVKFFGYHENTTPSLFRNKFFYLHMNAK